MTRLALFALTVATVGLVFTPPLHAQKEKKKMDRVFELRIYHANSGKMKALHARFKDHTNKLFKKHGMEIIGFWSPIDATEAEKKLYARQMEVFAGYSENADWNVGRLLEAIEEMGDLDNTLIFYIWGDNGASMEGRGPERARA